MYKIKTATTALPEDVHKDFRWAAKIKQQNVHQAGFEAIEDYIAKVKRQIAESVGKNGNR